MQGAGGVPRSPCPTPFCTAVLTAARSPDHTGDFFPATWEGQFGLIVFAFLGKARTTRQGRGFAVLGAICSCVLLRTTGFGVTAISGGSTALLSLLYIVPVAGAVFALNPSCRCWSAGTAAVT